MSHTAFGEGKREKKMQRDVCVCVYVKERERERERERVGEREGERWRTCTHAKSLQLWLSMGFSRQEYWSGLSCPSPGDLPDLGIKPLSLNVSCIDREVLYHCTWKAMAFYSAFQITLKSLDSKLYS